LNRFVFAVDTSIDIDIDIVVVVVVTFVVVNGLFQVPGSSLTPRCRITECECMCLGLMDSQCVLQRP